ncbi:MAG TPA: patatin-like phospholipase family protein [Chthoniobacterales bacterium]
MANNPESSAQPKSLADILVEELDGKVGPEETQELPVSEKQARLRAVYERIHTEQPERSALCLSGGGIRSGIFSLGILQGLARRGLLSNFDYLSTVSGGGYVGGWLSAWIRNHPKGAAGVVEELKSLPDLTLNPEPQPIRHLRAFSNYLTPRTGFTSVDAWTLIATYLRNVFLNWLVIISWLAAAMMVPRLYLGTILLPPTGWAGSPDYLKIVASYDLALHILLAASFILIAVAMAYAIVDVPSTGNAGLAQKRFLEWRQLPLLIAASALTEWWALYCNVHGSFTLHSQSGMVRFVGFAIAAYLAGGTLGSFVLWARRGGRLRERHLVPSLLRLGTILITTAFGGLCIYLLAVHIFFNPAAGAINYVCFAPPLILLVLLLVNFLFTGLSSWVSEDQDREWWARSAAWILISVLAWMVVNVVVLWGAQLLTSGDGGNRLLVFLGHVQTSSASKTILGAFGGVTGIVGGWFALRSKFIRHFGGKFSSHGFLTLLAVIFFLLLSLVISWLLLFIGSQPWADRAGHWLLGQDQTYQSQLFVAFFLTAACLLFGIVMGFFINVNKFSLHATYRTRLIRAFLAASRTEEARRPHLFTGFDPNDNIRMSGLRPSKPFHVVNAALNLVKGRQLAWQERKAESFTMSRLHCGSWHLGYRPSLQYGDGISLGTALTISGAAANPSMGYHSSPMVGFLMTLFNVRLGWWLGNPGRPGAKTWPRGGPSYAVGPLFSEAIGNTTDSYPYVNLSDGGHFDNLGLYEMVLRRSKLVMAIDAGQDFDYVFEDLGNAIRKIRIDLGIPIEIKVISPKQSGGTINHCAYGTIRYSVVDDSKPDGALIYIKPVVSGDEPPDVANYAAAHPEFPHEPTTDQWFSESQLESYRLLGLHAIEAIGGERWEEKTLPEFFREVKQDLSRAKSPVR